jgi:predicted unusual protein kinase regulating ubiquinone biosynthesis (AarF/ABC1/UbiB family)
VGLRAYWRFVVVTWRLAPFAFALLRDRRRFLLVGGSRSVSRETQRRRAESLLQTIFALGPTFIKLGQLLSSRPDVLPPVYVEVLSELQDRVPPAPLEDVEPVLADVGGTAAFDDFETEPISGASLGQVYRAEVRGQPVAVKVRRPGIEALVAADLRAVRWILPVVRRFVDDSQAFSLQNLADEFEETIGEELDYEREARMLESIGANFDDHPQVIVPEVVDSHSGERVLTMTYVEGIKVTDVEALDAAGVDRTAVAETLQRAYLQMIVEDGVFHADPHPGNLAVKPDGRIVFYDFGMSGTVSEYTQDRIVDFYVAVAEKDVDAILDALIDLGTLSPEADREVMGNVMELAIADARGETIEQYRVQQIVGQIEDTMYEFPLRLPADLALVLRVATVVEGVCVTLDPEFDFIRTATDFLTERGYREAGARRAIESGAGQLLDSATAAVRIPPKFEALLDDFEREAVTVTTDLQDSNDVLRRFATRVIYGLFAAVGFLSTALLYSRRAVPAAAVAAGLTLVVVYLLRRSFKRRSGVTARPQFTRQNLRARRGEDQSLADDTGQPSTDDSGLAGGSTDAQADE